MEMQPLENNQLVNCSLDTKGGSCPALVMARIPVTVGNCYCYTGFLAGRTGKKAKGILARTSRTYMRCPGPAAPECPAKARLTGTLEIPDRLHVRISE